MNQCDLQKSGISDISYVWSNIHRTYMQRYQIHSWKLKSSRKHTWTYQ